MSVISKVRRFIRQHDLMRSHTRVVCAVSGGSDSVALAALLEELHGAGAATFAGLVHLNHQLRSTAERDEQACRDLADRLQRPILVERADVSGRARRERQSVEAAAHDERYALFARARAHFDAAVVALGHTRDDQAETFLLRLLRGAGPRGLASMHPRRGDVVRPLLDCSRAELREFVGDRGLTFIDDETNADVTIPRNRIRAELMPHLADFNPNIARVLAREADLSRDVWSWLESELDRFGADLDVERLRAAPPALRRLALWRAMTIGAGGRPIDAAHVQAALALLDGSEGASVDAPGVRVHRIGSRIVLTNRSAQRAVALWRFPLSIPGEVAADGLTVSAELVTGGLVELARSAEVGSGPTAAVRADQCADGLAVRNRRPGDRFRPVGLRGRKKLQDLFVDRKVARGERDGVPIVVDDRDRIVWVAGHGIDEAFRVTEASQAVIVLKLRYS